MPGNMGADQSDAHVCISADPYALFQLALAGHVAQPEVRMFLGRLMRTIERVDPPLLRHVGVPTKAQRARQQMDFHLAQALGAVGGGSWKARTDRLSREVDRFRTRGAWRAWLEAGGPPGDAPELERHLFEVCQLLRRTPMKKAQGTSGQSIRRRLAHLAGSKKVAGFEPASSQTLTSTAVIRYAPEEPLSRS